MSNKLPAIPSYRINSQECHKQRTGETRRVALAAAVSEDIKPQLLQDQLACRMGLVVDMELSSLVILSVRDRSRAKMGKGEI